MDKINAVRGMNDITPDKAAYWAAIEQVLARVFASYGYREMRMPIVESTRLFKRSIGDVTDIVEKEMYTFPDRNDDLLSLRPEGTAGCVRACIENNLLDTPEKLWYSGPMFRYERPQKGRQRQFHQVGGEVFGYSGVEVEAEMLIMIARFWRELGVDQSISLQLNNIGSAASRARYRDALVGYLQQHVESLDADSQRRMSTNPLRILDSKSPETQALLAQAPMLSDFVDETSLQSHQQLKRLLQQAGIDVIDNPRLIRGLDYYNDTVFEWVSSELGAQATVCGGGRYDGLVEQLGGRATPAVGFAMGMERLYLLLEAAQFSGLPSPRRPDVYMIVADPSYQTQAFSLSERLRSADNTLMVQQQLKAGSMKSQFKKADKSQARFVLILGEDEINTGTVSVKQLSTGEQWRYSLSDEFPALLARLTEEK